MKNRKNLLFYFVISLLTFTITVAVGFIYMSQRNICNQELNNIIDDVYKNSDDNIYKKEFIDEINDIAYSYEFRTNSQIKNLYNYLRNKIDTGECYIENPTEQLSNEEMLNRVNYIVNNSKDYNVGKIIIYTDGNYKTRLIKNLGYVECNIFAYNLTEAPIYDYDAKIKIRGNSTAEAEKKPYNIKFSEKVNLYGFGEAKKWSLLAEYFDSTMLRNNLFLNLANTIGLEYTSNCKYVEVWVDDDYRGTYLLTESVETGKNRVDIDIDDGDFLLEYEAKRIEDDVTYIETKNGLRFAISDPEDMDENTLNYIKEKIVFLDEALFSNNFSKIEDIIDIESFVKLFIVNEYAKTVDFGYSSVNFYYKNNKFYAGPVWDFDLSSGNADVKNFSNYWLSKLDNNGNILYIGYEGLDNWNLSNKVFSKLYQYQEFREVVKDVFNEYGDNLQNLFIDGGKIDYLLDIYGDLILNNYTAKDMGGAGWCFADYPINEPFFCSYEENVIYLKSWLKNRYNYLNDEFNK